MPRTLVTYFSQTGNTRKVAEAIFGEISAEKVLKPMAEVGDLAPFRNLIVGFPVHGHSLPYPVEVFLERVPEGRNVALFSTHGAVSGSVLSREALEYASVLLSKARVLATFSCRGRVAMQALDVLMKSPENEAWAEMAPSAATHPDERDLDEARAFARRVMTILALKDDRGR
jgi:flavodoxin